MSEFLAALLEPLVAVCLRVTRLFGFFLRADDVMMENSMVGEAEMDREARRSWRRWGARCLILIILTAAVAAAALWWCK
ncbi:hypothetical protein [Prosthecobacter sp.]|uniref:hypothetical protein n=1 Tax=Prosthecobacter sp. TaxID=1965333 RepID=UPI001D3C7688|nr:hypothetical protein [Prosthecobacter sp.]MCB1277237.1 hypothetical protein [Prosthecobacter sp.]